MTKETNKKNYLRNFLRLIRKYNKKEEENPFKHFSSYELIKLPKDTY